LGTAINESLQNEIQITVIATGFAEKSARQLSAAEYFGRSSSISPSSTTSSVSSSTGEDILDVPDFLKKND